MRHVLLAFLALPLTGCFGGNPIEGTWKSDYRVQGNDQDEFTLEETDDDVSTGTGIVWNGTTRCPADVEVRLCNPEDLQGDCPDSAVEGQYTLRMHPTEAGGCGGVGDLQSSRCILADGEDRLDCDGIGRFLKEED